MPGSGAPSCRLRTPLARSAYVLLIAGLLALAWVGTRSPQALRLLMLAASLWWLLALAWLALAPQRVGPVSAALAGVLALVPAGVALMRLRLCGAGRRPDAVLDRADRRRRHRRVLRGPQLGRVKLAPRVSPGKTWEGVIGGLVLAIAIGAVGAGVVRLPLVPMLFISLAVAAFSVVGDLTESMLKRYAGIKDSGSLFPGHGGLLDRIDSICAGAPVLLLGLLQLEAVT
ncbi:MAG: phosphatidate cytidylyltransferase [Steroidobacteraceae bacterium]